jgi:hypothetical protein
LFGGCLHKWGEWDDNRHFEVQHRRCTKCKAVQQRYY